jgi:hypothetical protein
MPRLVTEDSEEVSTGAKFLMASLRVDSPMGNNGVCTNEK